MSGLSQLIQQQPKGTATPNDLGDSSQSSTDGAVLTTPPSDGSILSQLTSNPLFTAVSSLNSTRLRAIFGTNPLVLNYQGFGLVGATAGLALLRSGLTRVTSLIRRQLLVDLEIPSKDKSYDWFLHWMSAHQRGQLHSRLVAEMKPSFAASLFSRITPGAHHLAVETTYTQLPGGAISTAFALVPGPGKHLLNYHNTLISVSRLRDAKHIDMRTGSPFETIILTTLYRDRNIFPTLLSEAQALAQQLTEGKTVIYTSWGTEWKPFGAPRRKRPLESVILDTGVKESLVSDVKDFLASSAWYYDRGIPYRRGYLLYGPPGSGKSSFINALAGELDYNICVLNLSERGLTDDRLNHLLTNLPDRSIALLEDVDAAFANRRVQTGEDGYRGANVTFSGLLNALDGVASGEERIIMLTTNHRERLDEALVRPGRVDREVHIGWATESQVREMWARFYMEGTKAEKDEFVKVLMEAGVFDDVSGAKMDKEGGGWGMGISTAQLQGLFVYNKGDPEGALRLLREVVSGSLGGVGKEVR